MNYAAAKIYKIESPSRPELGVYYGATTQTLANRMSHHRCDHKRGILIRSSSIIAAGDAVISLVEQCVVASKAELAAREAHWIKLNDCVNKATPGQTPKEYREVNAGLIASKRAAYYVANREKALAERKVYVAANREQIAVKQAEYYAAKREHIRAQQAENYEANRELRKAKQLAYNESNRALINAKAVEYRAANRDKIKAQRAAKKAAV